MTATEKRLTVAVVALSCMVVAAVVALSAPVWAHRPQGGIVMIPHTWIGRAEKTSVWGDYVFGAGLLGFAVAVTFLYGKNPWKQNTKIFAIGFIWGMLSWVAGALPVLVGLLFGFTVWYFNSEVAEEEVESARSHPAPYLKAASPTIEILTLVFLGTAVSVGLRYGLMTSFYTLILLGGVVQFFVLFTGEAFHSAYSKRAKSEPPVDPAPSEAEPPVVSDTH
jgi:hypothetical protein